MVLKEIITVDELFRTEPQFFPDKVKFCLDRETGVVAVCREMHTDLEIELYDNGSDQKNIFGGNILKNPVSVEWEAHPNIERNRELGTGTGRLLTDDALKDELLDLLKKWIR